MTTPRAEASFNAPLSHFAQMRADSTWLSGPASIRGKLISRNTRRPVHKTPNTSDDLASGATTHHIVPSLRAPHTCADSSSSFPTCNNAAFVIRVTYDSRVTALAITIIPTV